MRALMRLPDPSAQLFAVDFRRGSRERGLSGV
jgi:hypothetical protein